MTTITIEIHGEQDAKCQTIGCDREATVLQLYENKDPGWLTEPWAEWVCAQDARRYNRVGQWPETGYRVIGELRSLTTVPA